MQRTHLAAAASGVRCAWPNNTPCRKLLNSQMFAFFPKSAALLESINLTHYLEFQLEIDQSVLPFRIEWQPFDQTSTVPNWHYMEPFCRLTSAFRALSDFMTSTLSIDSFPTMAMTLAYNRILLSDDLLLND